MQNKNKNIQKSSCLVVAVKEKAINCTDGTI